MKVTVCFGAIKVIVPCGDGNLGVGELIEKSVQRYKKATGRNPDYWVHVHSLASQNEGGILDIDDIVGDVADDREKLTANFEEQDPSRVQVVSNHLLGDGTSTCASSVGTASPVNFSDMNHINNSNNKSHHYGHHGHYSNTNGVLEEEDNEMDVVVTGQESDSKLVVRRGSDPIINMSSKTEMNGENAVIDKNANTLPAKTNSSDKPRSRRGSRDELNSAFSRFGRDSARQSLSSNHPDVNKWTDAQQKAEGTQGGSGRGPDVVTDGDGGADLDDIVLTNDGTPLGVHIISKIEQEDGSAFGIVVHSVEPGGRAARDGRLIPGDYIVQINGSDISLHSFNRAQEMLREAMRNPTVKLTVQRDNEHSIIAAISPTTSTTPQQNGHLEVTIPPKSPGGKVPPVVPIRSPTTSLSSPTSTVPPGDRSPNSKVIAPTSTRRIGRKLYIQLMKGPQGLGFSVTSRDNPTGGKNPIFIKNILPKGAAISDGRLKPGDRLMEVNGIEMTGKSQTEAVSILRSVKLGGVVNLVVSRQDSPVKMVPRQLPEDAAIEDPTVFQNRAVMTFDIPLNDTGSAGLGVSVKGKTSGATEEHPSKDLGIFIKSVIHGGAASKDGRLRPNDQLLCINETSLANMSNSEAMETLRMAMSHEKSPRSTISLVIARRLDQQENAIAALANNHQPISKSAASTPTTDRNVDSGLMSPLPGAEGKYGGMPFSKSDGILSARSSGNEIVVQASVEPQQYVTSHGPAAKVTYPGGRVDAEPIYSKVRKGSSGQTLPGGDTAHMMVDAQSPRNYTTSPGGYATHPSTHSSPSARAPSPPQWLLDWEKTADPNDGELSPLPNPEVQFDRDSYARASFSERRQGGSLDAKQMAWYKKTKGEGSEQTPNKQNGQKDVAASTTSLVRANSVDSLLDSKPSTSRVDDTSSKTMGPALGMEKSSSLESLEVAVASVQHQREDFPSRPRTKVRRGRVCNDSFRAAVDRSYQDTNGDPMSAMYTVMESEENGGYNISRIPSSGSADGGVVMTGNKKKDKKEEKGKGKTGTGFKGLFRFGKNRKSIGSDSAVKKDKDAKNQSDAIKTAERQEKEEQEKKRARQQAKQEQEKIQEEVQRLREQQASGKHREESQETLGKSERMMQLRQQYQQRHRDRQGQYIDDMEDDIEDDYTRVDPRMRDGHDESLTQRERLEAARAEQRERERQSTRGQDRSGGEPPYDRFPPEAEDRRKGNRDDLYAETRDRRDDRTMNGRYSEDPYADPRSIRNQQDRERYYDDYGRPDDYTYEKYNGRKEQVLPHQNSRDGRKDERQSEQTRQERRRSLKRTERVENAKNREGGQGEERRPNERRSDRSSERRKREDPRYDARRDERYDRKDGRQDARTNERYDSRGDERYYERGGGDGDRYQDERRDRQPPRDDRYDRYADQRDRYRVQQGERQNYSSLDRPTRKPRTKDPSYYSMSEEIGNGRMESDYAHYSNKHNEHPQRRPPSQYPNGPVPNHTGGGGGDNRYRRSKSSSDYLDYRVDEPRRSKSTTEHLDREYDTRRSVPSQSRKGQARSREYEDAARV